MNKEIIDKVISLRKQKVGYKKIARELNLTFGQVSDILIDNGLYSHVTMPEKHNKFVKNNNSLNIQK